MSKRKTAFRLWALALGEKAGKHDRESDTVALIRTFIFASYLITNIAIVANAWRHWNDIEYSREQEKRPAEAGRCLQNQ